MDSIVIKIRDFTKAPGPRYIKEEVRDANNSGERFRDSSLYPTLLKVITESKKLIIDLDGTEGYGTSFLEESFGGLIREKGMDYKIIKDTIELISKEEPYLIDDINKYLSDADGKSKG
jgi:hypothetical protein